MMTATHGQPWLIRHWLLIVNAGAWTFALLPILAPTLMMLGFSSLADPIYSAYSLVCHQWAHRSYFLFGTQATYSLSELATWTRGAADLAYVGSPESGYKIGFCERDLAIYLSIAAAGSLYALHRARILALPVRVYVLLLAPIVIDGFTQLFGWRESTPLLRLLTGGCFGMATVWFIYPRVDVILNRLSYGRTVSLGPTPS
jgi:uncharacterized membrane protein